MIPRYVTNTLRNVALNALGRRDAAAAYPVDCCYLVTWRCNLRCVYCYESAPARCPGANDELDTAGALRALEGIRKTCDIIVVSGGEPTMRADLPELLAKCRELKFREVILNTNGVRLPEPLDFLDSVHAVMVGLDALTLDGFQAITKGTEAQFRAQMQNLETLLRLREERRFDLHLSSVIVPGRLDEARRIADWCYERGVLVAFSPHVSGLKVAAGLKVDPAYRELVQGLVDDRRSGKPLMGSVGYYEGIRDLAPFNCIPMANLTVNPTGEFRFPCGEAETVGRSFAEGVPFPEMLAEARARHGGAPRCVDRCHFGCRLALSSLINKPWELPDESLHLLRFKRYGA